MDNRTISIRISLASSTPPMSRSDDKLADVFCLASDRTNIRGKGGHLWTLVESRQLFFNPPLKRWVVFIIRGLYTCLYGTKSPGREKSALNGTNQASLGDSPCPNHPSYRLGPYTHLEIYSMPTCTRISRFLGRQETCAGKGFFFL